MHENTTSDRLQLTPVGVIRSCYQQNFSIPRQPGLAQSALSVLILERTCDLDPKAMTEGIGQFSHLWVIFRFHQLKLNSKPGAKVRPPRLGGEKSTGVFATRSPYRPNPIGLSAVEVISVNSSLKNQVRIIVKGGDFLDHTPILDIKPYLPYTDIRHQATANLPLTGSDLKPVRVCLDPKVSELIQREGKTLASALKETLIQTLKTDPRPSWKKRKFPGSESHQYHSIFYGIDFEWSIQDFTITVFDAKISDPEIIALFQE